MIATRVIKQRSSGVQVTIAEIPKVFFVPPSLHYTKWTTPQGRGKLERADRKNARFLKTNYVSCTTVDLE